jgi:gliding motility-associated-like protein
MKHKYPLLAAAFALFAIADVHSQIMYSNGATIAVTPGGILWCNGGLTLDNTSNFTNDGSVTVTKNSSFALPGTFTINSGAAQGNGTYQIEQDWINNASFVANNSTVRLYGNTQQFITSINGTVTTFHNLTLLGNGVGNNRKKTLLLVNANSDAGGNDSINDRELETQTNSFFVLNTATNAVQNNQTPGSEGFVSSQAPGVLSRLTNQGATYTFPTGSSVVATRYRPVDITPNAATNNEYTVRFINHNPDNDGYNRAVNDGLICDANDTFYHAILRPNGVQSADVSIYYIPANDGPWTGLSQWRTSNNMWNDMANTNQTVSGIFTLRTRPTWLFANPGDPYVLTDLKPATPTITCPTFCENTPNNLFTASGGTGIYTWTVPGNGTIVNGQGTDSLFVDWTTGTSNVTVVTVSPTNPNCFSLPASCAPTVNPNPVAAFAVDSTGGGPWASTWNFIDQTTGATSWVWNFGDGNSSTQQNASNNYTGAGTYTVTLVTTNQFGCTDSASSIISVLEGILIPNVFSPNGDGTNDEFYIPNSGLKEYKIEIWDRWGVKVFESDAPSIHWDGRSTAGMPCTDGTYYYVLHALSDTHDYSTTGFLTLIGSKKD